jgi:hypothetical protein
MRFVMNNKRLFAPINSSIMLRLLLFLPFVFLNVRIMAQVRSLDPLFDQPSSSANNDCRPILLNCPGADVSLCDNSPNDPLLWNQSGWFDPVQKTQDLPEAIVNLPFIVLDTCDAASLSVSCKLMMDLDADGKVETLINMDSLQNPNTLAFGNMLAGVPSFRSFDQRSVPDSLQYRFALERRLNGDTLSVWLRWNTLKNPDEFVPVQLPGGPFGYIIEWRGRSITGHMKTCRYYFNIKDCAPPLLACKTDLSFDVSPNGRINVCVSDLLLQVTDNISSGNHIQLSVTKESGSQIFPVDLLGRPIDCLLFLCKQVGDWKVALWAKDAEGNMTSCQPLIRITDQSKGCEVTEKFMLCVQQACDQKPVKDVDLIKSGSGGVPLFKTIPTDSSGCTRLFKKGIPYSIDSTKETILGGPEFAPLCVSNTDINALQAHLSGIQSFSEPWQYIAADVNFDDKVDADDLTLLQQIAKGQKKPINPWVFYPATYQFPTPSNPFNPPFPQGYKINLNFGPSKFDYKAVQVGNLDCACLTVGTNDPALRGYIGTPYPNPVTHDFYIPLQLPVQEKVVLQLMDAHGRILYQISPVQPAGESLMEVPAQTLTATGVYHWRIIAGTAQKSGKVVVVD